MSQPIVQQVLGYFTDKTNAMAVKISRQHDEIQSLKKELAWMKEQWDKTAERVLASSIASERLEEAEEILGHLLVNVVMVGMDGNVYYYGDYIDPIVEEARKFLQPEPAARAS